MGDVDKVREDEEMEEGEASDSDEDVEVSVTLTTDKTFHNNNNGIPYGPDPITKHSFLPGSVSMVEEKPGKHDEPSSTHSLTSALSDGFLLTSLGLDQSDFFGGYWRSDTLHLWSSDTVDSSAIMRYFRSYGPTSVHGTSHNEWNVHWQDKNGPVRALMGLSCPIHYDEDRPHQSSVSYLSPSPPRPPTRRHNTSQEALGETSDKHDNQSKKKIKKKKSKKSDSSGSSDSSSSDSDDSSSSSSDSSSSDSDSSDSESDSSSDSDSSSSSSSDSDSSNSGKTKEKKRKKLAKAASKRAEEMEVEDVRQKAEGPAMKTEMDVSNEVGVKMSDVPAGCALPAGVWRLGVPCPQTRALLLRFANSDDFDRECQMKRRLRASEDEDRKVWSSYDEDKRLRKKRRRRESDEEDEEESRLPGDQEGERRRRRARRTYEAGVKARLSGPKLGLPVMPPPSAALMLYHPPRPDPFIQPVPPVVEGEYRDLDDPGVQPEDSKNPWGSLAQNWGKKETTCLDYQALLMNHRKAGTTGQKRKRDLDDDSGYDGARRNRRGGGFPRYAPNYHRRIADHHRYPDSGGDDRQRSDEEDDGSSETDASDDVVSWNTKMRSPRMKMYADVEEKRRKVKPKRHKPVSDGAQWDPRGRDAPEGPPRKSKSIFSRLGGGDVPPPRTAVNKFREREFTVGDRDWGPERPAKRSRVTSSLERGGVGGMRSEIHAPRARNIKSRLGGGKRF